MLKYQTEILGGNRLNMNNLSKRRLILYLKDSVGRILDCWSISSRFVK